MNNNNPKDFVANYEMNNYRYSDFWSGREYEQQAETTLLKNLFATYVPDLEKREIVDLGGAFGRLVPLYAPKAKHVVLADYSTSELLEGTGRMVQSPYKDKVSFLALNAYKMPLMPESVDALLSVRVMHHLKDIDLFWDELQRVISPGGVAIIEFANKNHILAILRHILRFNIVSYLRLKVLQVSHKTGSSQGLKDGQISIMYNFAPSYIKELSQKAGFVVEGLFACSFLRSGILKKLFSVNRMLKIETYLQKVFPNLLVTPSIFIVLRKSGEFVEKDTLLLERLACPTCGEKIKKIDDTYRCAHKHSFEQTKFGIVDLRDPRPESIDF